MKSFRIVAPVLFLSFLFSFQGFAQQKKTFAQQADEKFQDEQYNTAIAIYKKAYSKVKKNKIEKNRIMYQIGECYRKINDTKRSEVQYKRLDKIEYWKVKPEVLLYYGDALKINEKYDEASVQYARYKERVPNDPRGAMGVEACTMAQKWKDNPTRYEVVNEKKLNSKEDDFSPAFGDKKYSSLIFTSSRVGSTGDRTDDWTGQNFSDLYITQQDRKGTWSAPVLLDDQKIVNTDANEGQAIYNEKFNTLYYTICAFEKKKRSGCQIYTSEKKGRTWGTPQLLNIGGDSSHLMAHAALSNDELAIFFVSDMPGGQGGKDIWTAKRARKSQPFGKPVNLGPTVNSPGDEMFPYLRGDTALYFSSNYWPGMGGLDIFRCSKDGDKWSAPENMMFPVNSNGDDFGICFFPKNESGYLSSNRKGGKGGDDLYYFIKRPLLFTLHGVVKDDRTLQFIAGATIKLVGTNGTSIETKTDTRGYYNFDTTQILPATSYDLAVSKEGYFSDKGKETTVGLEKNKDLVHDFILVPIPVKPIVLPEILYDLDKWDLKPQFQDSLVGLIQTLEANPTIVVELGSHTDPRASDEYNDVLSQKRAQSVVDFLISRGIDPDRLVAKGYGERVPRTLAKDITRDGFTFRAGTTLTEAFIVGLKSEKEREAAYQLDRRTEFTVLRKDFIPKPKIDSLAKSTINVVTNPSENVITYTPQGEAVLAQCIIDGYNMNFEYKKEVATLNISVEMATKLLTDGAISKTDFKGDVNEALAGGTIADKAVFNVMELRIGDQTINDVEATVTAGQTIAVVLGDSVLSKFGTFTIDKEKNQIIIR